MILGIQLLAIIFSILMIYFTYVNYKKNNYGYASFVMWMSVWIGLIITFSFPNIVYGIMNYLTIERTADFFTTVAMVFLVTLTFYMYTVVKKTESKMERLVRQIAVRDASVAKKQKTTKSTTKK